MIYIVVDVREVCHGNLIAVKTLELNNYPIPWLMADWVNNCDRVDQSCDKLTWLCRF